MCTLLCMLFYYMFLPTMFIRVGKVCYVILRGVYYTWLCIVMHYVPDIVYVLMCTRNIPSYTYCMYYLYLLLFFIVWLCTLP
jgi:hypothetical protein